MIGSRVRSVVKYSPRQIEDQLLNAKTTNGTRLVTITDYWDRVVCMDNPNYGYYRFSEGAGRVLCPFHDDVRPSLGIVKDDKGIEVYNCFGCGAKGTVVGFHKRYWSNKERLNDLQLTVKLAKIYGVDLKFEGSVDDTVNHGISFNQPKPYTFRTHLSNIERLSAVDDCGTVKSSWVSLTERIRKSQTKKMEEA